ncbi:hypothetical protein LTR85_009088 [Meristemomyces frigidus]|nr:hypothetical protein LTR85_009088 [Meristemomyces frigidus]
MPAAISPPPFTPLRDTVLFKPLKLGKATLEHRIVQAPLTRMRATKESDGVYVPDDLAVEYYSQRASKGGLQLTEATDICHYASGYPGVPGVFAPSQITGWKRVTDAVHAKGGLIFCQLWHTGRASPPGLRAGKQSISASDVPISGAALDGTQYGDAPPRPMTVDEIHETTDHFAEAAKKAVEAGFDGVEIHGAPGGTARRLIQLLTSKQAQTDAVVMGRWFIANPDLPRRLADGLPLNAYDRTTFYGANPPSEGYTTYPFFGGQTVDTV